MTLDEVANVEAVETASVSGHAANRKGVRAHIARIAKRIADESFGAGALAELRRNHPSIVASAPSFHRLTANMDDVSWVGDAPLRWATLIQAIAIGTKPGESAPTESAGKALAEAGYSESRFARLLASRGETFRDQIVLLARYMNGKQARFDWKDLGELVLTESIREERAEKLRFDIARSYFRALNARQDENAT